MSKFYFNPDSELLITKLFGRGESPRNMFRDLLRPLVTGDWQDGDYWKRPGEENEPHKAKGWAFDYLASETDRIELVNRLLSVTTTRIIINQKDECYAGLIESVAPEKFTSPYLHDIIYLSELSGPLTNVRLNALKSFDHTRKTFNVDSSLELREHNHFRRLLNQLTRLTPEQEKYIGELYGTKDSMIKSTGYISQNFSRIGAPDGEITDWLDLVHFQVAARLARKIDQPELGKIIEESRVPFYSAYPGRH